MNWSFLCLFLFVLNAFCAKDPPRPQITEIFSATGQVLVKIPKQPPLKGTSMIANNQPIGVGMETLDFPNFPSLNTHIIQRFDMNTIFELDGIDPTDCDANPVSGEMPAFWSWVKRSEYKGQQVFFGVKADLWEATRGAAKLSLGVSVNNSNIPMWFRRVTPYREFNLIFTQFNATVPDPSVFTIPQVCQTNATLPKPLKTNSLKCTPRSTMISRAQAWVNEHVPYNQEGHHNGYREDCSGYVSMAWGLATPGLTTFTLDTVSHRITKNELQPGDVLLDKTEHVVLFGGWSTKTKDHYVAFEETRPGEGTVKRVTPYPYWYNTAAFIPYRYNSVC